MLYGVDVDSVNKLNFPFAAAVKAGYRNNYIKLGGGNLQGNAPYLMTSNGGYHGYVEQNRQAGADRTGHYWLSGGSDPAGHARFVLSNLDWIDGDFFVIDNEKLNYGNTWTDSQVKEFFETLWADSSRGSSIQKNTFLYGSQISLFGSDQFPSAWQAGVKAIIALYNNQQVIPSAPSVPSANIKGHQFTSLGQIPGYVKPVDLDVFSDDAFAGSVHSNPKPVNPSKGTNKDGSLTIAIDGIRGPSTIARWQEVMNTPIDGKISTPTSTLIKADQTYLNSVVKSSDIQNLTGKSQLVVDGVEGINTIKVRQFYLFNVFSPIVFKRVAYSGDFDGVLGTNTNKLHQYALNAAISHSKRY